jgi:hypothetical protein
MPVESEVAKPKGASPAQSALFPVASTALNEQYRIQDQKRAKYDYDYHT